MLGLPAIINKLLSFAILLEVSLQKHYPTGMPRYIRFPIFWSLVKLIESWIIIFAITRNDSIIIFVIIYSITPSILLIIFTDTRIVCSENLKTAFCLMTIPFRRNYYSRYHQHRFWSISDWYESPPAPLQKLYYAYAYLVKTISSALLLLNVGSRRNSGNDFRVI